MLSQYFLEVVPKNKTVKYSMLLKFFPEVGIIVDRLRSSDL